MPNPPAEIFKAYDIRGVVGHTLTPEITLQIGQAIGSEARARGQRTIAIGRDGRLSGPALAAALAEGIRMSGSDVVDLGLVATPMFTSPPITWARIPPSWSPARTIRRSTTA